MTRFGVHLRRLREEKGLTRYRLAKLAGITPEGVSKLERPGSDPKLSTLCRVARALGVPVRELLPEESMAGKARKDKAAGRGATNTPPA
jgi:transcriptional regulator with XRE-family HTH domain